MKGSIRQWPARSRRRLSRSGAAAKFDETVEIAMNLNLDPRARSEMRGTVMLPHGTGKSVRVAVFARGDREKEGRRRIVGAELGEKVQAGQIDFDRSI